MSYLLKREENYLPNCTALLVEQSMPKCSYRIVLCVKQKTLSQTGLWIKKNKKVQNCTTTFVKKTLCQITDLIFKKMSFVLSHVLKKNKP